MSQSRSVRVGEQQCHPDSSFTDLLGSGVDNQLYIYISL